MKYLKVLAIAILTMLTFGAAQAQVTVRAHIAPRHHHRHYHHVRHHHWHHRR